MLPAAAAGTAAHRQAWTACHWQSPQQQRLHKTQPHATLRQQPEIPLSRAGRNNLALPLPSASVLTPAGVARHVLPVAQAAAVPAAAGQPNDDGRPQPQPVPAELQQQQQQPPQQQQQQQMGGWLARLLPFRSGVANRQLLALSTAQMLASVATDLHDTYLPLFQRDVLRMSSTSMGSLHALLQLLPPATGIISGRLADALSPARVVIGASLVTAFVCKPMFALCGAVNSTLGASACMAWLAFAKVLDRAVKGLRETPSKALVSQLAVGCGEPAGATASFSLRHALTTLGMLLGATIAGLAYRLSGQRYEATFVLSTLPAALGALLVAGTLSGNGSSGSGRNVGNDGTGKRSTGSGNATISSNSSGNGNGSGGSSGGGSANTTTISSSSSSPELGLVGKARALLAALRPGYWQALAVVWLLYLARYDVSFKIVHASTVMDRARLPNLMLCSMAPVVLLAAPAGMHAKSSTRARNATLELGMASLIVGNLLFASARSPIGMALGSLCVGLHIALCQGVLYGMLAHYIPAHPVPGLGRVSGTAWSLTDLLLGVALALSNTLAGRLSDLTLRRGMGATGCFMGACAACAAAMLALAGFTAFGELGREEPAGAVQ